MSKISNFYTDMRDACFEELYLLAKKDKDIVLLIADQSVQTLEKFQAELPRQFINVGVSEQNMMSVAAGLSLAKKKVYVHTIVCFAVFRSYEQIRIDLGLMNLPVTILGIGAGLAYSSDGPSHHSIQDIAAMRGIPHMKILNASDTISLAGFMQQSYTHPSLTYIRFDKGGDQFVYKKIKHDFTAGVSCLKNGADIVLISTGLMVSRALEIAEVLGQSGVKCGVIDLYRLKPVNEKLLLKYLKPYSSIITLEEQLAYGGLGTIISDLITDYHLPVNFRRFGLPDKEVFLYGNREYVHKKFNLDSNSLRKSILQILKNGQTTPNYR